MVLCACVVMPAARMPVGICRNADAVLCAQTHSLRTRRRYVPQSVNESRPEHRCQQPKTADIVVFVQSRADLPTKVLYFRAKAIFHSMLTASALRYAKSFATTRRKLLKVALLQVVAKRTPCAVI